MFGWLAGLTGTHWKPNSTPSNTLTKSDSAHYRVCYSRRRRRFLLFFPVSPCTRYTYRTRVKSKHTQPFCMQRSTNWRWSFIALLPPTATRCLVRCTHAVWYTAANIVYERIFVVVKKMVVHARPHTPAHTAKNEKWKAVRFWHHHHRHHMRRLLPATYSRVIIWRPIIAAGGCTQTGNDVKK